MTVQEKRKGVKCAYLTLVALACIAGGILSGCNSGGKKEGPTTPSADTTKPIAYAKGKKLLSRKKHNSKFADIPYQAYEVLHIIPDPSDPTNSTYDITVANYNGGKPTGELFYDIVNDPIIMTGDGDEVSIDNTDADGYDVKATLTTYVFTAPFASGTNGELTNQGTTFSVGDVMNITSNGTGTVKIAAVAVSESDAFTNDKKNKQRNPGKKKPHAVIGHHPRHSTTGGKDLDIPYTPFQLLDIIPDSDGVTYDLSVVDYNGGKPTGAILYNFSWDNLTMEQDDQGNVYIDNEYTDVVNSNVLIKPCTVKGPFVSHANGDVMTLQGLINLANVVSITGQGDGSVVFGVVSVQPNTLFMTGKKK